MVLWLASGQLAFDYVSRSVCDEVIEMQVAGMDMTIDIDGQTTGILQAKCYGPLEMPTAEELDGFWGEMQKRSLGSVEPLGPPSTGEEGSGLAPRLAEAPQRR